MVGWAKMESGPKNFQFRFNGLNIFSFRTNVIKILFISLDRSPVNGLFLLFLKTLKEGINAMFEKHRKVSHFYNILRVKRATFMYFQTIHLNFRAVLPKNLRMGPNAVIERTRIGEKFNWDIFDVFPNIVLGKNSSKLRPWRISNNWLDMKTLTKRSNLSTFLLFFLLFILSWKCKIC